MADITRIAPERLEAWSVTLLTAAGVPVDEAQEVARHLVFADLRGIDTHGTSRLKVYLTRQAAGLMEPSAKTEIVRETPVSALMKGGNGYGQVVARRATDLAIAKAKASGVGMVSVYDSNHCGALAYYTLQMAQNDLIGFAFTNAPANMPPFGGMSAYFGTNPFSMAAPAGKNAPFVFDMATSQVARGKIINAAREGKDIPEGWAITKEGLPTTNSKAALEGFVLPMGGAKGSALAFMVEILSGVMSGALIGPALPRLFEGSTEPSAVGHFFIAFRPDLFMDPDEFKHRMDETIEAVRQVPPAPGFTNVLAPGDLERAKEETNRKLGVPITPGVRKELGEMAERFGVALPYELTSAAAI